MKVTQLEKRMLERIAKSEYHDVLTEAVWSNCVCDSKSDAAILGSLVKKGLVVVNGSGAEATVTLTPAGLAPIVNPARLFSVYTDSHQLIIESENEEAARNLDGRYIGHYVSSDKARSVIDEIIKTRWNLNIVAEATA